MEDGAPDLGESEAAIRDMRAELAAFPEALAELRIRLRDSDATLAEARAAIAELQNELAAANAELDAKEEVIIQLARVARAYRLAHAIRHPHEALRDALRRYGRLCQPRLGQLDQHPPLPLSQDPPFASAVPPGDLPTLSIVTPSYGQARFVERTLASVLGQGYPKLEYHIQDGGSRDGTVEILRRHEARLSGWESVPDDGQSQAINLGFARTGGEIMAWLNSDDMLMPGTLHYVADYFQRHPEVDVVYGHRILIDEGDMEIGRWVLPRHSDEVLSWADFVPQETLFWRRRLWEKVGGRIDESFRFAMDWDLLLRFRAAGARMVRLPRFLGAFRVHGAQKTSAVINEVGFHEMDRLRERVIGRPVTQAEIRRAIAPYLLRHVAHDLVFRVRRRLRGY